MTDATVRTKLSSLPLIRRTNLFVSTTRIRQPNAFLAFLQRRDQLLGHFASNTRVRGMFSLILSMSACALGVQASLDTQRVGDDRSDLLTYERAPPGLAALRSRFPRPQAIARPLRTPRRIASLSCRELPKNAHNHSNQLVDELLSHELHDRWVEHDHQAFGSSGARASAAATRPNRSSAWRDDVVALLFHRGNHAHRNITVDLNGSDHDQNSSGMAGVEQARLLAAQNSIDCNRPKFCVISV